MMVSSFFKLKKNLSNLPTNNSSIKNFKSFKRLYDNKKDSYVLEDFISGEIKRKYPHLEFRNDGDVDYDKHSKSPHFVSYNNFRLEISEAFKRNELILSWNFSTVVWEALKQDGYHVYLLKEENEKGHRHGIILAREVR